MMTLEQFKERAISVPFLEKGRSWAGWDCWGVVFMAFKEICAADLPLYTGDYSSSIRRNELHALIEKNKVQDWTKVDDPQALDGILLHLMGRTCHIGLMINATHFLHVEALVQTHVDRINDRMWRGPGYDKIKGFYRHVSQI